MPKDALSPIQSLLDQLAELRTLLNQPGKKLNPIEAYQSFIKQSAKGRNCTYALKCEKVFLHELYQEIKDKLEEIQKTIDLLDK